MVIKYHVTAHENFVDQKQFDDLSCHGGPGDKW